MTPARFEAAAAAHAAQAAQAAQLEEVREEARMGAEAARRDQMQVRVGVRVRVSWGKGQS